MSTNIRVDVTLQRLQNQSRQATNQNRTERQEREEDLLKPASAQTTTDLSTLQRDPTSVRRESPFDERHPAAQRGGFSISNAWVAQNWDERSNYASGIIRTDFGLHDGSKTANHYTSISQEFYVGCGDGTQWKTISCDLTFQPPPAESWTVLGTFGDSGQYDYGTRRVSTLPSFSISYADLVLPAGDGNFIYVAMLAKIGHTRHMTGTFMDNDFYTETFDSDKKYDYISAYGEDWSNLVTYNEVGTTCRAFVCNRKKLREIAISATLQEYLNVLNPAPEYVLVTEEPGTTYFRYAQYYAPSLTARPGIGYVPKSFRVANVSAYSPDIYWYLNNVLSHNPNVIHPDVAASRTTNLMSDQSAGGFQFYEQGTSMEDIYNASSTESSPLVFGYRRWAGTPGSIDLNDEAGRGLKVPRTLLTVSGARVPLPASTIPPDLLTVDLLSVTDWGDPGYCRRNLQLLGIPTADHKP